MDALAPPLEWIRSNVGWIFGLSAALFVVGLVLMPLLLIRMSPDHFVRSGPRPGGWRARHTAIRLVVIAIRNVLGVVLLLAGILLLVLPGQGIITIVVGLSLITFPGKRRLELRLIRQPPLLKAVNWIRDRAGRPPLILPDDPPGGPSL